MNMKKNIKKENTFLNLNDDVNIKNINNFHSLINDCIENKKKIRFY